MALEIKAISTLRGRAFREGSGQSLQKQGED